MNELKTGTSGIITAVGGDGALRCRLVGYGADSPHPRRTAERLLRWAIPIRDSGYEGYELTLRVEEAQKNRSGGRMPA